MQNFFVLLLATFMAVSCSDDTAPEPVFPDAPANPDKAMILLLVNEARSTERACGSVAMPATHALTWSETLATVARKHSEDMDAANRLSHQGTNGSFTSDRLEEEGYIASVWAENLAVGSTSEHEVISLWLDSPGHCENIMNDDVLEMGVGTSGPYWTMVLARK